MAKSGVHWARTREAGSIVGMKILLFVYRLFGRVGFRLILIPVMAYFFLFRRDARQASKQYLKKVGLVNPESNINRLSFQHFLMFGEIILDKVLVWMGEIQKEDVVFENSATIDEFDKNLNGGVIIVSHLGNNEICSALAEHLPNIKLTLLIYTQHAEKFNSLIEKVSEKSQIKIFQVTDMSPATAMILSDRVKAGEYVVIAGDRIPVTGRERVTEVSFLNAKALMPQGAFILAGLLSCPIYLLFCLKHQSKYHIYIELFATQLQFRRKQRNQIVDAAVHKYAGRLQHYCYKAPLQWFNFYPFWIDNTAQAATKSVKNW